MTQLLIVHRDPEIGRDLVQLVKDYTGYESVLTHSESETLVWLRRQPNLRPRILLTQLQAPGLDGFILGALLGEMFSGLQTLFLPAYAASSLWAWLRGRDPYRGNAFEREAFAAGGPTPPAADDSRPAVHR